MKTGLNYINGVWKTSQSGKTFDHHDPADIDYITDRCPGTMADDTKEAVFGHRAQDRTSKIRLLLIIETVLLTIHL
jgi:hypothetical protein